MTPQQLHELHQRRAQQAQYRGQWEVSEVRRSNFPTAAVNEWITAQGEILQIPHMATDHLVNVASMLWRTGTQIKFGLLKEDKPEGWRKAKLQEILRVLKTREVA